MLYLTKNIYIVTLTIFNNSSVNNDKYITLITAFKKDEDGKMIPLKKRVKVEQYYHMTECHPVTDYLKNNELSTFITGSRIDKIIESLNKQNKEQKVLKRN